MDFLFGPRLRLAKLREESHAPSLHTSYPVLEVDCTRLL